MPGDVYVTVCATVGVELCDCQAKGTDFAMYNRLGYKMREEDCNFDEVSTIALCELLS